MVNYATHIDITLAFVNFEIDYHFLLGCIRRVRYVAGLDGFVPEVRYHGKCNPDDYFPATEKTGIIVNDYLAPVEVPQPAGFKSSAVRKNGPTKMFAQVRTTLRRGPDTNEPSGVSKQSYASFQ